MIKHQLLAEEFVQLPLRPQPLLFAQAEPGTVAACRDLSRRVRADGDGRDGEHGRAGAASAARRGRPLLDRPPTRLQAVRQAG